MKRNKKFWIQFFGVAVVAALAVAIYFEEKNDFFSAKPKEGEKLAIEQAKELDIKSFSLEGIVDKVSGDSFLITVSLVTKGRAGNEVGYQKKNIKLSKSGDTQFNFISRTSVGIETSGASFSDVKEGSSVVVHTADYPFDLKEVMAIKVDILVFNKGLTK